MFVRRLVTEPVRSNLIPFCRSHFSQASHVNKMKHLEITLGSEDDDDDDHDDDDGDGDHDDDDGDGDNDDDDHDAWYWSTEGNSLPL